MTTTNLGNLVLRINGPDIEDYAYTDFSLENIPYDGSVSLHFITKINFDLTADLVGKSPNTIIVHNAEGTLDSRKVDSFDVELPADGYYEIITLVLPTTDYVEHGLGFAIGSKVTSNLNTNIIAAEVKDNNTVCLKILTHSQDEDSGYYEHIWTGWKDIDLTDVLVMLEQIEEHCGNDITIKKYTQSAFVFDNLYKCYIKRAEELLKDYTGDSSFCSGNSLCKDSLDKSKIQIRDYLWMAINVINYCIQNCQYLKALKILNCVSTCSGICADVKTTGKTKKVKGGCGCNKRS